jgi:hypothetical protein
MAGTGSSVTGVRCGSAANVRVKKMLLQRARAQKGQRQVPPIPISPPSIDELPGEDGELIGGLH